MKNLIKNRRSRGWNLIEIIVAVAIGASIAAAGVIAYQGEARKASVAKAMQFVSQVETKKASIVADFLAGNLTSVPTGPDLDKVVLADMTVNGLHLSGDVAKDAPNLGFAAITIGELDLPNVDGKFQTASATLNDGTIIDSLYGRSGYGGRGDLPADKQVRLQLQR